MNDGAGGRPRKPSKLRILEGHRGHRPIPEEPPTTAGAPDMPARFTELQQQAWKDLVHMAPHGVVTHSEGPLLEISAIALAKMRAGTGHPYQLIAWHKLVLSCLAKLGMTPVDRSKVGIAPKKPEKAADLPSGQRHGG